MVEIWLTAEPEAAVEFDRWPQHSLRLTQTVECVVSAEAHRHVINKSYMIEGFLPPAESKTV